MAEVEFVGWILYRTEEEIRQILEEIRKRREGNWYRYGKDGFIEVWRKLYRYKGVPYEIACLKYFDFNREDPLKAGLNKVGMHLVLEYTKDWRDVHKLLESLDLYHFWLWEDTLHAFQKDWSLHEMEQWLHERAKRDIDFLIDEAVKVLEEKLNHLKKIVEKVKEVGGNG